MAACAGRLTPRLDRLASEGIRLNNFNVEFSCTVSRAALMTGRYAIRSGATQPGGITLWEVTIAEALKSIGYATALFGKWHLGGDRSRRPARAVAPGIRRVLRDSAHQQRGGDHDRAGPEDAQYVVHLGGRGGTAVAERQAVQHGHAPARSIASPPIAGHRVHGEARAHAHAVLRLLPDHADPFPDAAASGLCRQDRRRRHRRHDGGDGRQRRPRARRHRPSEDRAQHDRVVVHGQRRRAAAALARIVRARGRASTTP